MEEGRDRKRDPVLAGPQYLGFIGYTTKPLG
jgi:hypothetical protein